MAKVAILITDEVIASLKAFNKAKQREIESTFQQAKAVFEAAEIKYTEEKEQYRQRAREIEMLTKKAKD